MQLHMFLNVLSSIGLMITL